MIPLPSNAAPVVTKDGHMQPVLRRFLSDTAILQISTGAGTPEGALSAVVTSLYMDTAGTAGSILYIKRDSDIAGDSTKGWILV